MRSSKPSGGNSESCVYSTISEPRHASPLLVLRLVVFLRPRSHLAGPQGADRRQRRDVRGAVDVPDHHRHARPAPRWVLHDFWIWQLATYMFLHGGIFHILFNMLALWMFGAELERVWGTRYFLKFYFVTGIGAGVLTVLFSLLPFAFAQQVQQSNIIGASGAIYGLLLAYALYFPDRPILLVIFPVPAKIAVAILGAIAFYSSLPRRGRHGQRHAPRRPAGRVSLSEGRAHPSDLGGEVPLPQMEDQPRPQEVRRLLGRPRQRLRPPRSLTRVILVTRAIRRARARRRADPRRRAAGTRHGRPHRLQSLELQRRAPRRRRDVRRRRHADRAASRSNTPARRLRSIYPPLALYELGVAGQPTGSGRITTFRTPSR